MDNIIDKLKIIPLGGLGEIGLNMMAFEYADSIIVVDCGLMFPEDYMLGIDIVIPDVTYLRDNIERVKAFVITHGHEDHIGALPFILKEINVPVFATTLTVGLLQGKLIEHGILEDTVFKTVRPRDVVTIGDFTIEFMRVSHSIVDAVSLAITTPVGTIIHTGDFKIDETPVDGELMDYERFTFYKDRGVLALLSDSTNVERSGHSVSESKVGEYLEEIFSTCEGRIFVASFSSNIHRMQQVFDTAVKFERNVILNGRSMVNNVRIARELGFLNVPDKIIVDFKHLDDLPPDKVVLLTTGSQGEPRSALLRMAMDNHKQVKIREHDTVVLSSKFIPGNEKAISNMMNHLYKRGARVIYEKVSEVHVSGHAHREELRAMLEMTRPEFFIPVHGEYRHLFMHAALAKEVCVKEDNVIIAEDGDVVEFTKTDDRVTARKAGRVESGKVFVDGKGVGDVGEMVLKDRKHLSEDGMVVAIVALNEKTGEVTYGPDVITRGVGFEEEGDLDELIDGARERIIETLNAMNAEAKGDPLEVTEEVRVCLRRYFNKALKRRPVILPLILDI
jgi:ribonuclease J